MYKAILIDTHGTTEITGTVIHVYAAIERSKWNFVLAFVYDSKGKLEKAYQGATYRALDDMWNKA